MNVKPIAVLLALLACGCTREPSESRVNAPGPEESAKTQALETGAELLQHKAPLGQLNAYLNGFHFYNGAMDAQMEAHHYCGHLTEEVIQCVIYDANTSQAKLMGVEYIVSRNVFTSLPAEEKHLWHSHVHEVRSGQLIALGVPDVAEHELMEKLAGTYGKTWHTWHTDAEHRLPLGIPRLMMGFTADAQANVDMVRRRDERFDVSSTEKRQRRADIAYPPIDPDADAWQAGKVIQLKAAEQRPGGK